MLHCTLVDNDGITGTTINAMPSLCWQRRWSNTRTEHHLTMKIPTAPFVFLLNVNRTDADAVQVSWYWSRWMTSCKITDAFRSPRGALKSTTPTERTVFSHIPPSAQTNPVGSQLNWGTAYWSSPLMLTICFGKNRTLVQDWWWSIASKAQLILLGADGH